MLSARGQEFPVAKAFPARSEIAHATLMETSQGPFWPTAIQESLRAAL